MPTENEIAVLQAARAAGIQSRQELANFLAQVSHESAGVTRLEEGFRYTRGIEQIPVRAAFREGREALELARREALDGRPRELARLMYGGRMGNDDAGDGYLYRGRGFIQLTGEDNYRAAARALDLDLVDRPWMAAERDHAAAIAVWYWREHVAEADRNDVSAATRAINGGENGLEDRHDRFDAWHGLLTREFLEELDAGRIRPGTGVAPASGRAVMADGALRRFESGDEVRRLQEDLAALGMREDSGRQVSVDGNYGAGTEQAVRRFQQRHGLAITGRADPQVLDAVREALVIEGGRLHREQPHRIPVDGAGPEEAVDAAPSGRPRVDSAPLDPRDVEHPDHAALLDLEDRIRQLHVGQVPVPGEPELARIAACVMADARQAGLMRIALLEFAEDPVTGQRDPGGRILAWEGPPEHPATRYSVTDVRHALVVDPDESWRRHEFADRQVAVLDVRFAAQDALSGPMVRTPGLW